MTLITGWKDLEAFTGLCRSVIWSRMHYGGFPKPLTIKRTFKQMQRRAWITSEVEAWMSQRTTKRRGAA